ncbi:putative phenol 2-monooxygenase [Clathrospora elynae]|uniref:Putative phenol 2-monooxygenase n=1 Tax=Clathrospora elynae TaxID=706981 RepID=A0A6A5SUE6_9PLEO|nr:putative phenol 2-monooxygenase [Clathrospora elynae]
MSTRNVPEVAKQSKTDVFIIGAGPAGLMAAWWMARCGINARIIDKRGTKVINGHADGLRPRTDELFASMGGGIQEKIEAESYMFENLKNWVRGPDGKLTRIHTQLLCRNYVDDLPSPFLPTTISQGRIERFIIDGIDEISQGKFQVERGVMADTFTYDASLENDPNGYPIELTLRTLSDSEANPKPAPGAFGGRDVVAKGNMPRDELTHPTAPKEAPGTVEVVKARYLIGCDGGHSWLRRQLDYKTEGSTTDSVWGTMDIIPMTDFPDIFFPGFIKTDLGTLMIIPRERNLTRIYVPFSDEANGERFDRSSITLENIVAKAKKFFAPYTLDFKVCEWWTVYQVGQRVSESNQHPGNRIFLAGDAVHMHSPKVGLGMNTSMQDGYNVGWKIAMVAAGAIRDENAFLSTYAGERYPVAKQLVKFDRTLFGDHGKVDPENFRKNHVEFRDFSDGFKLEYPESVLVSQSTSKQTAATGLTVGESFKHHRVLAHATSQLCWTTKLFQSDGRFRIVLMAGDVSEPDQMARVKKLCDQLESEKKDASGKETSLLHNRYPYRFTFGQHPTQDKTLSTGQHPSITFLHEKPRTSMISLLAIHSAVKSTESLTVFDFPAALYGPFDAGYHGYDYTRILVDEAVHYDRYCDGRAYDRWGIDRTRGAVVVVRPDMHVGWVGDLEDSDALVSYFATILK